MLWGFGSATTQPAVTSDHLQSTGKNTILGGLSQTRVTPSKNSKSINTGGKQFFSFCPFVCGLSSSSPLGFGTLNTSSLFGSTATTQPQTSSLFSSTPGFGDFSECATAPAQVGTTVKFVATAGQDTINKNGEPHTINTNHQCITAMKEYKGKSLEELRFEDYQANRKTAQQTSAFGSSTGTNLFSSTTQPAAATSSAFGGSSLFGGASTASTGFGGSKLFGATTTATPTTTGLFGESAQPAQATSSFLGAPATTTATTTGFGGFGSTTTQPATTSVFGQATAKPSIFGGLGQTAAAPTTGLFGSTSTTTAPATTGSIFGQVFFFNIYIPNMLRTLFGSFKRFIHH